MHHGPDRVAMDEIDRLQATLEWLEQHHPGLPDWVLDTITFRVEYTWEAIVRVTEYGPVGTGFEAMLRCVVKVALADLEAGKLERIA
jgi:hypothetical protein